MTILSLALSVFDSSVAQGQASAVYAEAWAHECSMEEVKKVIPLFSQRVVQHGGAPWPPSKVTGKARLFLLATDGGLDRRIPVPLPTHTNHRTDINEEKEK